MAQSHMGTELLSEDRFFCTISLLYHCPAEVQNMDEYPHEHLTRLRCRCQENIAVFDGIPSSCSVLCSEMAVKQIDEPFVTAADDLEEWAV